MEYQGAPPGGRLQSPGVSLILTCGSNDRNLEGFLEGFLASNSWEPWELILVGSPADSRFSRILSRSKADYRFLFLPLEESFTRVIAGNLAAANAAYPFLLFADPGISYESDIIPSLLERMEARPDIGAAGVALRLIRRQRVTGETGEDLEAGIRFQWSSRIGSFQPVPLLWESLAAGREETGLNSSEIYPPSLSGRFMLCRRDDFDTLGGFSRGYGAGLVFVDFCLRLARDLGKKCWCHTADTMK